MSPLRIIGYIGIAILSLMAIFILWISVHKGDLKGLFIGFAFVGLLIFLAHSLRSAAIREHTPDNETTQALGWYGVTFRQFFNEVMLKSLEGWLVLICASLCLLNIIVLIPNWSWESLLLWLIYPWVPFMIWIKMASPDFQLKLFSIRSIASIIFLTWSFYLPAKSLWMAFTST